jgi:hypothetical protein
MQFTFCQVSPTPTSLPAVPTVPTPGPSALLYSHNAFSTQSTLHTLQKQNDTYPFNQPVDPVPLKIPHYFNIITRPMDFGMRYTDITLSYCINTPTCKLMFML